MNRSLSFFKPNKFRSPLRQMFQRRFCQAQMEQDAIKEPTKIASQINTKSSFGSKWKSRGKVLLGTAVIGVLGFELLKYQTIPQFNDKNFEINNDRLNNIEIIGKNASRIPLNDINRACNEMREIYKSNITRPLSNRKKQLQNLINLLTENENEIINALYRDLGRDIFMAKVGDFVGCKNEIQYLLNNLYKLNKPKRINMSISTFPAIEYEINEPYGTVFVNGIWNFPFGTLLGPIAGCIAAGNNVIVKPCNTSSACSELITNLLDKYMDSRFVQVLGGANVANGDDYFITDKILENQFDFIFFTGSSNGGKYIMSRAAKYLTPVLLELGGKNPVLIDETADIDKSVRQILTGRTVNCGQMCIAPDYVLCHCDRISEFLDKSCDVLNKWFDNQIDNKYVGKMVNVKQFDRVIDMLNNTSGDIVYGGNYNKNTLHIEPTVVHVNDWNDYGMKQETFGPILWVKEINDLNEGVNYINDQPKSLSLYMFSENQSNQNYVVNNTSAGGMQINGVIGYIGNENIGFGGVGDSGMGSYHGSKSFYTFCHTKPVVKSLFEQKLLYPPRDGYKLKLLDYM